MVQIPRSEIARAGAGPGRVNVPPALRSDVAAAGLPARTVGAGLEDVARVSAVMAKQRRQLDVLEQQAQELGTVSKLEVETNARVSQRIEEARVKSPTTFGNETVKIYREESANLAKQTRGLSAASQKYLLGRFNSRAATEIPASRKAQTQAIHREATAATLTNIEARKQTAIAATDPTVKATEEAAIAGMLGAMVSGGMMQPLEAKEKLQSELVDIDTQRGTAMYLKDPDAFIAIPLDQLQKMHPNLDAEDIEDLLQGATKEGDRREKEEEEATERLRKERMEILYDAAGKQELPPALVNKFVGDNFIKPEDGVALLKFQSEAAKNRVTTSDPDAYQFLDETMMTANPAEWNMLLRQNMSGPDASMSKADGLALIEKAKKVKDLRNIPGYSQAIRGISDFLGGAGYRLSGMATATDKQIIAATIELNNRVLKGEEPTDKMWGEIAFRHRNIEPPQIPGMERFVTRKQVTQALADGLINEETTKILIAEIRGTKEFKEAEAKGVTGREVEKDLKALVGEKD